MSAIPDPTRPPLGLRLDAVLRLRAETSGGEPALIFRRAPFAGEILTWRALDRRASEAADALRTMGVEAGDRVAVALHDSPGGLAGVFGVWRAGAVLVPLDARWGPHTRDTILDHVRPACLLGHDVGRPPNGRIARRSFERLRGRAADADRHAAPSDRIDDLAIVAYTSGTTANPKGVMIRHRHLRHAYAIARTHLFDAVPRRFGSVFRMGGLGVLGLNVLFAMECGSAVVVLPELTLETADRLWEDVREASVDFLYLVPTLVQLATRMSRRVEDPRRIECVTGAAPIARELHAAFQDRFGHPLRNIYGITEASFGVFYGAYDGHGRGALHLGRPASPIEVRLTDAAGAIVGGEGDGHLEVSGPVITDGYWRNPSATREVFAGGWLRTGDIAHRDADGHYTIVGRAKDVVIRGGFNIHLEEVDHTLAAHPAVLGACAVGIARGAVEEELVAAVQVAPRAAVSAAELSQWCRGRIGPSRTPGTIYLVDRPLPQNASGKVVRRQVIDMLKDLDAAAARR